MKIAGNIVAPNLTACFDLSWLYLEVGYERFHAFYSWHYELIPRSNHDRSSSDVAYHCDAMPTLSNLSLYAAIKGLVRYRGAYGLTLARVVDGLWGT